MPLVNPVSRLPLLRPVPIFLGLTKGTLLDVARESVEVTYPPGASVVRQGDPGDALYIVAKGTVEVQRDDRVVAQLTAGGYFGEISLIDHEPRSATVVAIDEVVLLKLSSSDFEPLLYIPYLSRVVMKNLARLLRTAEGSHGPTPQERSTA
jgi:CRP-like cAMP-binding protein